MNKQQYLAQPIPALTEKSVAIIEAVKAANFILKDEHDSKGERTLPLAGVVVYQRDDRQEVVALFNGSFSAYYCLNAIELRKGGVVAVTRDNCASIVTNASNDPIADVKAIIDGIAWDRVEKYPVLCPGQYFNFVMKEAA